MKSAAFAPTKYTGTGILRYKVRANFATRSGKVASAYSPTQPSPVSSTRRPARG